MELYVDRIDVHYSTKATCTPTKDTRTTFLADGHVVNQGAFTGGNGTAWSDNLAQMSLPGSNKRQRQESAPPDPQNTCDMTFADPTLVQAAGSMPAQGLPMAHLRRASLAGSTASSGRSTPTTHRTSSNLSAVTQASSNSSLFDTPGSQYSGSFPSSYQPSSLSSSTYQGIDGVNSNFNFLTSDPTLSKLGNTDGDVPMIDSSDWPDLTLDDILHQPSDQTASTIPISQEPLFPFATPTTSHASTTSKSSSELSALGQVEDRGNKQADLPAKRMKKLASMLDTLRASPTAGVQDHNSIVRDLVNHKDFKNPRLRSMSAPQFAEVLERLSNASTATGFVFGLLSWEIFRREEERLAQVENLSPIAASKAANKQMVDTLKRRAKTRDWASDGRKAAKMVIDTLKFCTAVERSFALLLLAKNVSLDGLLKVAHFPATRERFCVEYAGIVNSMLTSWNLLSHNGYKSFDYEEFLSSRRMAKVVIDQQSAQQPPSTDRDRTNAGTGNFGFPQNQNAGSQEINNNLAAFNQALLEANTNDMYRDGGKDGHPAFDMPLEFDFFG